MPAPTPATAPTPTPDSAALHGVNHWQSPLSGHGLAYFRELVVDYKTLQWINPYAAAATAARKDANEKAAETGRAEAALLKSGTPEDPTLKRLLADAKAAAAKADEQAAAAEAKKTWRIRPTSLPKSSLRI